MSLTLLAPELLLSIVPLLERRDVSNLSQTCKALRRLCLSQLYRSIQWRWFRGEQLYPKILSSPPIHLLVRSLIENPGLRKCVERIDFDGEKIDTKRKLSATLWPSGGPALLTEREIEGTIQSADRLQLSSLDRFCDALKTGDIDAYVALGIALLPDLQSLRLGAQLASSNSTFLGFVLRQGNPTPSSSPADAIISRPLRTLTSLQNVSLGQRDWGDIRSPLRSAFLDAYTFFYLPALKILSIQLPRAANFAWPNLTQRAPMSTLNSLTLPYCEASESALEALLATKPPLQQLTYKYSCAEAKYSFNVYIINLRTISLALSHVRPTLRSLTLEVDHQAPDSDMLYGQNGFFTNPLDSLADFPQLHYLRLPFIMLTGWDLIPRSYYPLAEMLPLVLQHVCFTDELTEWYSCEWHEPKLWYERLEDWLPTRKLPENIDSGKSNVHSGLRKLEILKSGEDVMEWTDHDRSDFVGLGDRYGVEVCFTAHDDLVE